MLLLSTIRIIQIYFVQGLLCIFFLIFAIQIISRKKQKKNLIFSAFYISEAIGIIINFIYAPLTNETLVTFLNFLTNFFTFYAPIFLLIFILILYKSEKVFDKKKQLMLLISTGVIYFCMFFIAIIPELGVEITKANNYTPHWGWLFFTYVTVITTGFSVIPTLYYSYKIYNAFEDSSLKKKWRYFLVGNVFLYILLYFIFIRNAFFAGTIFSTILSIIGLGFSVAASLLVYYGVGKQLE
jgi:hypothetical protein